MTSGLPRTIGASVESDSKEAQVQYVGIDWAYRRAAWCAMREGGDIEDEGLLPADEDGLAKLVLRLGSDVRACVEMMSGAVWVRDRLQAAGWGVEVADARKVKGLAPLACKTDKVDARVLAELCRRNLVPTVWLPSLDDRALRERLKRRMHLVRMRTMARNRIHGVLSQWGLKLSVRRVRQPDGLTLLEAHGVPAVWRRSVAEALAVIDWLDGRLAPLEHELRPLARADARVELLETIPGIGPLLGLTMAAEIGDVARFPSARQLVGYAGLAPKVKQSGQSSRSGPLSKAGSKTLRWAAVEAAQQASEQPMAPALPGDGEAPGQDQRRQGRGRAQGPDRRLARALAQPTVQALPPPRRRRPCPGQLPLSSGRPTAHNGIEKPGQLRPTRCAAERRKRTEHVLHQPSGVMRLLTANPSSKR
jgi:transposase